METYLEKNDFIYVFSVKNQLQFQQDNNVFFPNQNTF